MKEFEVYLVKQTLLDNKITWKNNVKVQYSDTGQKKHKKCRLSALTECKKQIHF